MDRAWYERNAERKRAYNKDRKEKIKAGTWKPHIDVPGAEAVIRCEECSSLNGGKR